MIHVLFVCAGNICRSPTAEGVLRSLAAQAGLSDALHIDSAGTHGYHVGDPPDPRSVAAARRRGIDLSPLRARTVSPDDFSRFDLVLALDQKHRDILLRRCPPLLRDRIHLLLDFVPGHGQDVPDPYYGDAAGFERVLDLTELACRALLCHLHNGIIERA